MKKVLRIILFLVLWAGAVSVYSCTNTELSPEVERAGEKATIEAGVQALMWEKGLTDLSKYADGTPTGAPVRSYDAGEATNDMTIFPSTVWHLYPDYERLPSRDYYYTVENDGTVRQFGDPAKTVEYNAE
jgi:hypothetical protein